jgi:hypothetical protein
LRGDARGRDALLSPAYKNLQEHDVSLLSSYAGRLQRDRSPREKYTAGFHRTLKPHRREHPDYDYPRAGRWIDAFGGERAPRLPYVADIRTEPFTVAPGVVGLSMFADEKNPTTPNEIWFEYRGSLYQFVTYGDAIGELAPIARTIALH